MATDLDVNIFCIMIIKISSNRLFDSSSLTIQIQIKNMKIYLLVLSIFLTTLLSAQNKWTVGVTTGIGYSGWHTNKEDGEKKGAPIRSCF